MEILPFPRALDRTFIDRQCDYAASLGSAAAGRHLARQIELQAAVMRRRGVAPDRAAIEIARLREAFACGMRRRGAVPEGLAS